MASSPLRNSGGIYSGSTLITAHHSLFAKPTIDLLHPTRYMSSTNFFARNLSTHLRQPSARPAKEFPGRFPTFRALRHRDFRLLWIGLVISAVGTWMQIVARSLLVLKMTHGSTLAL